MSLHIDYEFLSVSGGLDSSYLTSSMVELIDFVRKQQVQTLYYFY